MALLELNNPETAAPPAASGRTGGDTAAAAQMHADEEYARQLMAQMEREHMQEYGRPLDVTQEQQHRASSGGGGRVEQANYNNLNYVPRQRNRHGQPAGGASQQQQYPQGQQGDGQQAGLGQWLGGQTGPDGRWKHQDELDQLTDQFNKFADSESILHLVHENRCKLTTLCSCAAGKKTFSSFLSKAKDKYAQTAQQRALQAQSGSQHQGGGAPDTGIKIGGFKLPNIPSPWQGGTGFRPGEKPMTPEREELRSGALSPDSRESVLKDYSQSPSRPSALDRRNSSDGEYSVDAERCRQIGLSIFCTVQIDERPTIQINKPLPTSSQAQPIRSAPSTNAPTMSSPPATAVPGFSSSPARLSQQHSRGSFTSGSPAKVQMLPRQTINLFDEHDKERNSRSASPATGTTAGGVGASNMNKKKDNDYNDDDSDSDVEYVRNPFNDDD
jgi:hypothetical protein